MMGWAELVNDEEHSGCLVPMMMLLLENDEDPKMRPKPISPRAEGKHEGARGGRTSEGVSEAPLSIRRFVDEFRRDSPSAAMKFAAEARSYQRRSPSLAGWYGPSVSAIICWYRIEAKGKVALFG
jgi:hypothetical protein